MPVTIRCTVTSPCRISASFRPALRAVVVLIEVAERTGVTAPMLIVALIRRDEGEVRHVAGAEVLIQAAGTVKSDDVSQAVARIVPS